MPGIPSFASTQLSTEQIQHYKQNQHAEQAARDIAAALGLSDYQHDAATAVCVDYVSYTLNFARDSSFTDNQTSYLLALAQKLLQQAADVNSTAELQSSLAQDLESATRPEEQTLTFTTQQVTDITTFFTEGLLAHHKLYNYLFSQPQEHIEHKVTLQVETAVVEPLKDAMTEEQWRQYNADTAARAEAEKQAQEAAEQQRQVAEAQAAAELAAQQAEAERQSKLTKPVQTLDEAVEQAVALRVGSERRILETEYKQREATLLDRISHLETSLAAPPSKKK